MRKKQLRKRISQEEINKIIEGYITRRLRAKEACKYLNIGRTRLYQLSLKYRNKQQTKYNEYTLHN